MKDLFAFQIAVHEACRKDPRYDSQAYAFLCETLDHTAQMQGKKESEDRHVTGQEIMQGWRDLAVQQFGPMAWYVMEQWGVTASEAVGAMVYNFIGIGYFRKNESDSIEDFSDGVDLREALSRPFVVSRRDGQGE